MSHFLSGRIKSIDLGLDEKGNLSESSSIAILGEENKALNLVCHIPTQLAVSLRLMEAVNITLDFQSQAVSSSAGPVPDQLPLPGIPVETAPSPTDIAG